VNLQLGRKAEVTDPTVDVKAFVFKLSWVENELTGYMRLTQTRLQNVEMPCFAYEGLFFAFSRLLVRKLRCRAAKGIQWRSTLKRDLGILL
jgi:hypothetical protein